MAEATCNYDRGNIRYLEQYLGKAMVQNYLRVSTSVVRTAKELEDYQTVLECLEQMREFGDNHWWTSRDKRKIGYYQYRCPVLLMEVSEFLNAFSYLLGRPVSEAELRFGDEALLAESERAFNQTKN